MAAILGAILLALAGIFMLYVLAQFHLETRRPRKIAYSPRRTNVVPFRTMGDMRRYMAPHAVEKGGLIEPGQMFNPAGLRRIAAKRAGRGG